MSRSVGIWPVVRVVFILALLVSGCAAPAPIRLGFAGQLSGAQSDLGIQGRDAALLAVEDVNAAGGVAGRPLELVAQDDLGTPAGAVAGDQALMQAGVVAIIGHMTSAQTLAGLAVTEPAGMLLFSPTTSASQLTGEDDLFFRVISSVNDLAAALSQYTLTDRHLRRLAIVLDGDNAGYSRPFADAFSASLEAGGGAVVERLEISAAARPDWAAHLPALRAAAPDGLLLIMSAVEAAFFAQQTRLSGWEVPLFSSPWAQTEALLEAGGSAVEGMVFSSPYDIANPAPLFQDFQRRYQERFGREAGFAAAMTYESVRLLAAALETTRGAPAGLPAALRQLPARDILGNVLALNRYGDVVRPIALVTVQAGAFASLGTVTLPIVAR